MAAILSVLLLLLFSGCCQSQRVEVGDVANEVEACRQIFSTKIACPDNYEPVCAVVNQEKYINASNDCQFCIQYGNLDALIVQIGGTDGSKCAPLTTFSKARNDPYCQFLSTQGSLSCPKESNPICASMDNLPYQGSNKCEFCKKYGHSNITILTIGTPCTELKIGDIVRNNLKCRALARSKLMCPTDYNPICALQFSQFLNGTNFCNFCQKHGNTGAIVGQIGFTEDQKEFFCEKLRVGMKAKDHPLCYFMCKTWQQQCTIQTSNITTVCANLNGQTVSGYSSCQFCRQYGCTDALVTSMGEQCED